MKLKKLIKTIKFKPILDFYENDFSKIVRHENLSEDFINEFFYQLRPYRLEAHQKFSVYLMEKYGEAINWQIASLYQTIPEYLIEKHYKEVNWRVISNTQILSEKFIIKWQNYIVFDALLMNNNISDVIKNNVEKYFKK